MDSICAARAALMALDVSTGVDAGTAVVVSAFLMSAVNFSPVP